MSTVTEQDLMPIKIELAIRYYEYFKFNFFIKKNDKTFIEVAYKQTGLKNTFIAYNERGLTEIYLKQDDFNVVISKLKLIVMQTKKFKEAFSDFETICKTVSLKLSQLGSTSFAGERHKDVTMNAIQSVVAFPELADKLTVLKINSPKLFYTSILKTYISLNIAEQLSWCSDALKLKLAQACLFMDINLSDQDILIMKTKPRSEWPNHILIHPILNSQLLKQTSEKFTADVLQMIEFHHEFPDGEGFPNKVDSKIIPVMATIIVIAEVFAEKIEEDGFDLKNKANWTNYINLNFPKSVFKSVKDALLISLNKK